MHNALSLSYFVLQFLFAIESKKNISNKFSQGAEMNKLSSNFLSCLCKKKLKNLGDYSLKQNDCVTLQEIKQFAVNFYLHSKNHFYFLVANQNLN